MQAVQLSAYGGLDQLAIVDIAKPQAGPGEVLVRVVAAGTNPGEISIRKGFLHERYPRDFPFGQGSDFAGEVESVGANAGDFTAGDAVLGWSDQRAAQAEFVTVPATQLVRKPAALDWFRAGSLFVAASTAVAAVRAVDLKSSDVVVISGAAGGVGSLASQLAQRTGARVLGIASDDNAPFLRSIGVEPVRYGDGLADRLRSAAPRIDAFIDLFGSGYIELAVQLRVTPQRINTIIDFAEAQKYETKTHGSAEAATPQILAEIAERIAWGEVMLPITAIYPFASVHAAYEELERRKTRGKIVLALDPTITHPLRPSPPAAS